LNRLGFLGLKGWLRGGISNALSLEKFPEDSNFGRRGSVPASELRFDHVRSNLSGLITNGLRGARGTVKSHFPRAHEAGPVFPPDLLRINLLNPIHKKTKCNEIFFPKKNRIGPGGNFPPLHLTQRLERGSRIDGIKTEIRAL